jgi:hypothetical protein
MTLPKLAISADSDGTKGSSNFCNILCTLAVEGVKGGNELRKISTRNSRSWEKKKKT